MKKLLLALLVLNAPLMAAKSEKADESYEEVVKKKKKKKKKKYKKRGFLAQTQFGMGVAWNPFPASFGVSGSADNNAVTPSAIEGISKLSFEAIYSKKYRANLDLGYKTSEGKVTAPGALLPAVTKSNYFSLGLGFDYLLSFQANRYLYTGIGIEYLDAQFSQDLGNGTPVVPVNKSAMVYSARFGGAYNLSQNLSLHGVMNLKYGSSLYNDPDVTNPLLLTKNERTEIYLVPQIRFAWMF